VDGKTTIATLLLQQHEALGKVSRVAAILNGLLSMGQRHSQVPRSNVVDLTVLLTLMVLILLPHGVYRLSQQSQGYQRI
jgi:hypothetical protein